MAWTIPLETRYAFKLRSRGIVVWAIQRCLNAIGEATLIEDGIYGRKTEAAVATFQTDFGLFSDGIFGPATSLRLAEVLALRFCALPNGLAMGFVIGESSGEIGAVNWAVKPGVDCSYLMWRIANASAATDAEIQRAFDSAYRFRLLSRTTRERFIRFKDLAASHSSQIAYITDPRERSWRLAALAHNWPWGADRLANGYSLSNQEADWVPDGCTFDDGTPVNTYWEWAQFYAIGAPAHDERGLVTQFVDEW